MDIRSWSFSGSRTIQLGECYEEFESASLSSTKSNKLPWKMLWMKFKKKKRIFKSPAFIQIPYNPYTYSQNFDKGSACDEPNNFARSFSVRFADPSKFQDFREEGVCVSISKVQKQLGVV